MKDKQNETESQPKESNKLLNSEGFLFYYRQFVHSLLDELNLEVSHLKAFNHFNQEGLNLRIKNLNKDLKGEQQSNFNVQLQFTMYEITKLKQFANSLDNSEASKSIQEATDILKNMFTHVQYFKPDEFTEMVTKVVISVAQDPRVQISLVLIIIVTSMATVLCNQIRRHKFSVKSLVIALFILSFIISVVNNHFLIIQVDYYTLWK